MDPELTDLESTFTLTLLPAVAQLAEGHTQAGQQLDNLCGPYWAAILLRSRGFEASPEQIALIAGALLPVGDSADWLPAGAGPRQNYSLALPQTPCLEDAGTSAQGLALAVAVLTGGTYCLVPVQADWSAERVLALLRLCQQQPDWQAVPLANLSTCHLWGSSLGLGSAGRYLNGGTIEPPPPDWQVGHFLILAGWLAGSQRTLIWLGDTYPIFGWQGYHLQPPENLARALNRDGAVGGGVFLFTAVQHRAAIQAQLEVLGFECAIWDNGSPAP